MRKLLVRGLTGLLLLLNCVAPAFGQSAPGPAVPAAPTRVREIFVPFADLNVVLEADIQRVFLTRQEYEALLTKAKQTPLLPPPQAASLLSAEYDAQIEDGRALIQGKLVLEVLDKGLQALPLDLSGVGIRKATLEGRPAPLVRDAQGKPQVLVEGLGRKTLLLELVAPLETSAAWQSLHVQLPRPAAHKLRLVVPGNVEVKSGADVLQRTIEGPVTRFELLPAKGGEPLVMTLNNRQLLQQRVVMARSVLVDEVTQAYERLHASVSLSILRGAVEQFRFELPDGFEVNEVETPLLARWIVVEPAAAKPDGKPDATAGDASRKSRVLEVSLREPTTEPVRINITATRLAPSLESWKIPRFQPLDVSSHVAVVGLLLDERLQMDSLKSERLIAVDAGTITAALPASVFAADTSAPRVRPAAAFYAPQPDYDLSARFTPPPSKLNVVSNVLLLLEERRLLVRGGFELRPEVERLFHVDFTVPATWQVTQVKGADGNALSFETFPSDDGRVRLRVLLAPSVESGAATRINFEAEATPEGWIGDWPKGRRDVIFPTCVVLGATRDEGALAVHAGDDLQVRPGDADQFRGVTPLDANEKARFGLGNVPSDLVYRYEGTDYALAFVAERGTPTITARTYSFLKIEAENLVAHYELVFDIERAGVQKLAFWLPDSTPETVAIRGLDGAVVKEFAASAVEAPAGAGSGKGKGSRPTWRRWTVQLAERARDKVRLAVDFQQRLPSGDLEKFPLPLIRADEQQVAYQSGLVAVEGNAELDVAVAVDGEGAGRPKRIDVGELAQADYVVGRRVLGAFGFVGENPPVLVDVFRRPAHALPTALVQRAELITLVSRSGLTQTAARYQFRTKDLFLELQLPPGATLWSAYLDGQPLAPQRAGDSLLLSLTAAPANNLRDVQVVFEAPSSAFSFRGKLAMPAPTLRLRTEAGDAGEVVVVADLQWQLVLPTGYRLTYSGGSVFPDLTDPVTQRQLARRHSPWLDLAAAPVVLAYGLRQSLSLPYRNYASYELAKRAAPAAATGDFADSVNAMDGEFLYREGGMPGGGGMGMGGMGGGGAMGPGGLGGAGTMSPEMLQKFAAPQSSARERIANDALKSEFDAARDESSPMARSEIFRRGTGVEGRTPAPQSRPAEPGKPQDASASTTAPTPPKADEDTPTSGERRELAQRAKESGLDRSDTLGDKGGEAKGRGVNAQNLASVWALEGVRSLPIEFTQYVQSGNAEVATFRSLGVTPRLEAALVNRQQLKAIALSAALLLGLFGVAMTNRTTGYKTRLVVLTLVVVTVLPLAGIWINETTTVCHHVFWAAIALAAWYLTVGLCRKLAHPSRWPLVPRLTHWCKHRFSSRPIPAAAAASRDAVCADSNSSASTPPPSAPGVSTAMLLMWALVFASSLGTVEAFAQADDAAGGAPRKVKVPDDAIIVPYNPDDPQGVAKAERILVPLAKYQELWTLANPGRAAAIAEAARLPAQFAWSGARYDATLAGADDLTVTATLDLELFATGTIDVPLLLTGGVLTNAQLDGQPASLRLMSPAADPHPEKPQSQQAQAAPQPVAAPSIVALTVRGPGRKQLTLTIGMKLQRRGGWRVAEGRVPVAPSTSLVLQVPDAKTEVRLGDVFDRARFETKQPNERIETALGPLGILNLQWRPKVAEAEVDKSLTVTSKGDIELREDVIRVVWSLNLEFPRSRRESFSVYLPADYLLERVLGDNIRGWNVIADEGRQRLDVTLLKAATDHESFAVVVARRGRIGDGALAEFPLPTIDVTGAALHQGTISIARSPWLDVRLDELRGLDRTDIPAVRITDALNAREESPLGIQPYQALKFATSGYAARLRVTPMLTPPNAELRSVWKIDPREMAWETQFVLRGGSRPTYQLRLRIPEQLTVDRVVAANLHDWAITSGPDGRVLTIYLTIGVRGEFSVVLNGRLPAPAKDTPVAIPQVTALDVGYQDGYVVVQVDPSVNVTTEELQGLESVLLNRTYGWLSAGQRGLARLALHVQKADYSGALRLVRRNPRVTASSVTNVRVTGRSIEETLLIDFRIEEAGIRQVSFLLPAWMREARITAPLLREKRVTDFPVAGAEQPARVRVQLDLQDEVMGSFRVLVEHDRLLTAETQEAPIPVIETGRTEQRLIAVESSGRDEIAFDEPRDVEPLAAPQQAWNRLTELFGKNILAAYQVKQDAASPRLSYHTRDRQTVETVGARIGLAETQIEVDSFGAYRAKQTYHIDNGTEQFLLVAMPAGATLWTAVVADEPVKPQQVPGGSSLEIRVPIVKTAPGDLDYTVELTYGGQLPPPGAWGQMRFPLMRTANINVELSRVRLLLPPSHRWFRFGGTMGRVDDRGQYEAGFLEYQTKQLSRLSELLQGKSEDDLRRLRVTNNLKQLGLALHSYQSPSGNDQGLLRNDEYSRNLSTFNSVLQKTQEQVASETAQQQVQLVEQAKPDNRSRLNGYFLQQDANRASNVVGQLGENFGVAAGSGSGATPQPAAPNAANPFNAKWFEANGLEQSVDAKKAQGRIMDPAAQAKKDAAQQADVQSGKKLKDSNEELREQLQEIGKQQLPQKRAGNKSQEESLELNRRYQQRLEQQGGQRFGNQLTPNQSGLPQSAQPNAGPALEGGVRGPMNQPTPSPVAVPPGLSASPEDSRVKSELPRQVAAGDSSPGQPNDDVTVLQADLSTGMSSLTVELPGRGTEFLFITPRGELEITAYTVERELLGRLERIAIVAAVLGVLGVCFRVYRRVVG